MLSEYTKYKISVCAQDYWTLDKLDDMVAQRLQTLALKQDLINWTQKEAQEKET